MLWTATRAACFLALVAPLLVLGAADLARADDDALHVYSDMSLEALLEVEVTSVSKKSQRLVESASAVYVITAEDIRRSGHTSIPELLRMVPGMNVARVQAGRWAVSARGGQDVFANNLLVMIDGRTIYTPLFGGTYWEMYQPPLADIAQIEVIRGPGATVWGANAVNGVVNIITKHSRDSEGSYAMVRAGNEERFGTELRHGLKINDDLSFRISGNYLERDASVDADNHNTPDGNQFSSFELRSDWDVTDKDALFFSLGRHSVRTQTGVRIWDQNFNPSAGTVVRENQKPIGGHGDLRWTRKLDDGGSIETQIYYDALYQISGEFKYRQATYDATFQHNFDLGDRHSLVWGLGARRVDFRTENMVAIVLVNEDEKIANYSAFLQDEITILPEKLKFTMGSKASWNSYTNWEIQPRAQIMWTPDKTNQVWASVSRAVRTPAQSNNNLRLISAVLPYVPTVALAGLGLPATYACQGAGLSGTNCPVSLVPNEDFEAEVLTSYEIGYRLQPRPDVSLDFALFYMDGENLGENGPSFVESPGQIAFLDTNRGNSSSFGAEVAAVWEVKPWWRLSGSWQGYQLQNGDFHSPAGAEAVVPHHQFQVHSRLDLPWNLEFDTSAYYTGRREWIGSAFTSAAKINSHVRFDARLGWRPMENVEVAIVAQDLFDRRDPEFSETLGALGLLEIERSIYGQVRLSF